MMNVTPKQVEHMKPIVKKGSKPLQEAVKAGKVPVSKAAAVVHLPKAKQLAAATRKGPLSCYAPNATTTDEPEATPLARIVVHPLDELVVKLDAWWESRSVHMEDPEAVIKKVKSLAKEIKAKS